MIVPRTAKAPGIEQLEQQIREMEAELTEDREGSLDWDDLPSASELAEKEQRRAVLPRILRAARIKRLELRVAAEEKNLADLRKKSEEAHAAFRERQQERMDAEEAEQAASGQWNAAVSAGLMADQDLRRMKKELAELKVSTPGRRFGDREPSMPEEEANV
jgi:hypothetical protein